MKFEKPTWEPDHSRPLGWEPRGQWVSGNGTDCHTDLASAVHICEAYCVDQAETDTVRYWEPVELRSS